MKAVGEIAGDVVCVCLLLKNVKFILVFFSFSCVLFCMLYFIIVYKGVGQEDDVPANVVIDDVKGKCVEV